MKNISFIVLGIWGLLSACTSKSNAPREQNLDTGGMEAAAPYFTQDNKGNAVLCWTEKDRKDSLYRLKFAVYNIQTGKFNTAVTVPASAGCSNAPESMAKVAFKADGTVLALFSRRFTKQRNPYAGAIYYSFSKDTKTWSDARFLHTDTAHTYGRSFFDITTLKNGELGAIWLDGRYGESIKGSALYFARTEKGRGFGADSCLDKGTCECCRTDIFTDNKGNIHLAYRNITYPSALSGRQIRDMAYKQSADNGKTFSSTETISKDNWQITGCPHSGPALAATNGVAQAVWFTAGGGAGLYYASSGKPGGAFGKRMLVTASGRHPQLAALPQSRLAIVCEEPVNAGQDQSANHAHGKMQMRHMPAGAAKIMLYILTQDNSLKSVAVTAGNASDHHAVLTSVDDKLLIAWVRDGKSASGIQYTVQDRNTFITK